MHRFGGDGRALIIGETDGLVKIVADADGPLLGVHIAGPWATELLGEGYLCGELGGERGRPRRAGPPAPDAERAVRRGGARAHRPLAALTHRSDPPPEENAVDVTMPQLGETVTEGTITRWLKQVGEHVEADEPLFEVSTDKVDSEVPAPVAGVVTEILVPEGETVEVGARLAVLGDGAASPPAAAPVAATAPEPAAAPEPAPRAGARAGRTRAGARAGPARAGVRARAAAHRRRAGARGRGRAAATDGHRRRDRSRRRSCGAWSPSAASTRARSGAPARAVASPARTCSTPRTSTAPRGAAPAPRHARAHAAGARAGTDARRAEPSPHRYRPRRSPRPRRRRSGAPRVGRRRGHPVRQHPAPHRRAHGAVEGDERARVHVGRGRLRARRARARARTRREWKASEGFSLTYLPFIARAFCDAVHDYPQVNASVDGDTLVVHHDVNLSASRSTSTSRAWSRR